jgi:hypothetical protein
MRTPERRIRSQAYGRVVERLAALEPLLDPEERDAIREACDALIFDDEDAAEALAEARDVCRRLADGDRLTPARAHRLLSDIEGCGGSGVLAGRFGRR